MKNLFRAAALVVLFFCFNCDAFSVQKIAQNVPSGKLLSKKPAPNKKLVDYMFVLSGNKGTLKKIGKGEYILSLRYKDHNQVVMFSNSPRRAVKYITLNQFLSFWYIGKNSFSMDPPNAVLTADQIGLLVVKLTDVKMTKKTIDYHVKVELSDSKRKPNKRLTDVVLTIDQFGLMTGSASCASTDIDDCTASRGCELIALYIYTPDSGPATSCYCGGAGTCPYTKNPNAFGKNCEPALKSGANCSGYVPIVPIE